MDNQQFVQSAKIALLIDFDNVILGVEDPGFDVELVVNALRSRGVVVMGRAYGDWYRHHRHRRKLMEQGIELVETPAFGPLIKNSADIRIVIDGLDIAAAHNHIDTFCLVSGDSDFLPLIKRLQLLGKNVIVIAGNKFTSDLVRRNCNEYVSYENLLAESVGATEDATSLEGAFHLLGRAINTLEERGMDVRSSAVKQMMLQLNPVFSERTFGCYQFKQFLDRATRAGLVSLLERDNNGEHSVELRDRSSLPGEEKTDLITASSTRSMAPTQSPRDNAPREGFGRESSGREGFVREGFGREESRENGAPEKNARERMRDSSRSGRRFGRKGKDDAAETSPENAPQNVSQMAAESATTVEAPDSSVAKTEKTGKSPASINGAIAVSVLASRPGVRRGRLRFSAKSGSVETQSLISETDASAATSTREGDAARETSLSGAGNLDTLPNTSDENGADEKPTLQIIAAESETAYLESEAAPKKRGSRGGRRRKAKTDSDEPVADTAATENAVADSAMADKAIADKEAANNAVAENASEAATESAKVEDAAAPVTKAAPARNGSPRKAPERKMPTPPKPRALKTPVVAAPPTSEIEAPTVVISDVAIGDAAVTGASSDETANIETVGEEKKKTSRGRRGGAKRTAAKRATADESAQSDGGNVSDAAAPNTDA